MRRLICILTCALAAKTASADTHIVLAYDMTFEPAEIIVAVGDTVLWEYVSGAPHTVTSGANCTWDGVFHAPLSIIDPVVEWSVPEDAPSVWSYFCAPHCINGMVGVVHIVHPCNADVTGDGEVGTNDLLAVLADWGEADSPADADGDGLVGVNDLLMVVSDWGPCA